MKPLERHLAARGFAVVNWGYPSLTGRVADYAAGLAKELERLDGEGEEGRIHVVGHSMGAILAREALRRYRPRRVGRVVLMAPPLRGTRMVRRLKWLIMAFTPLALDMAYVEDFKGLEPLPAEIEVGVIAARFDHLVSKDDTLHAGHVDHVVINWTHTLTLSPKAIRAAADFLAYGRFTR